MCRPHPTHRPDADAPARIGVSERYLPLLEQTATALLAERCRELYEGVEDGHATRHVADLLTGRVVEVIDARREIVGAAGEDEGYLSIPTLRLVGPRAVHREHHRLTGEWERGGDDVRALANHTELLADLGDFLITTPGAWPTDAPPPPQPLPDDGGA
jgi:hypothetical protein